MTTPPDDVAAMFDLPPPAPPTPSATADIQAEEAALATELASALESGAIATDAPDSRTDLRLQVSWPARMRLADGRVIHVKVRNISESGVGLLGDKDIPASTVVDFEMDVPQPADDGQVTLVKGSIRTAYAVTQGAEILCGGTWQEPPAGVALVNAWIEWLRG